MRRKAIFAGCFIACGAALTALLGHLTGPGVLPHQLFGDAPMAISTAMALIALALAIIVLVWDNK